MSRSDDVEHLKFIYNRLAEVHGENVNVDYMARFHKIISELKEVSLDCRYVLVTENDCPDWMLSRGPIAAETYVGEHNASKVIERAKSIGDRYGRQMICRLEPIGDLAKFEQLMDNEV